jgi:AAA domain
MDLPSYRCKTNIVGIADATPPIQVGDLFLVRPTCPIRLPHPHNPQVLLPKGEVIEIQTLISHITRKSSSANGGGGGGDQILATWLNAHQHQLIMHRYQAELAYAAVAKTSAPLVVPSNGKSKNAIRIAHHEFHVRIVPNPKHLVRCLTALTWLAATCPAQMAMELLFPTTAPLVPNDDSDEYDDNDHDDLVDEKKEETVFSTVSLSSTSSSLASSSNQFSNNKLQKDGDDAGADNDMKKLLNDKQASFVRMVLRRTRHAEYHQVRAPLVLTGPGTYFLNSFQRCCVCVGCCQDSLFSINISMWLSSTIQYSHCCCCCCCSLSSSRAAGTGKTKTLLCAIQKVLACNKRNNNTAAAAAAANSSNGSTRSTTSTVMRILVCTPSHTAADVVTKRLSQFLPRHELFRLLDPDRPIATVPTSVLGYCRQDDKSGTFVMPSVEELLNFQVIVCTCYDAHLLYMMGLTNHQLRLHRQELQRQTIKSFRSCGVLIDEIPGVNEPHWTHLFIDEAAQATEPESLIPLSVVVDPSSWINNSTSRKVEIALVGDPRQLQPRVYCSAAAQAGLERSFLERLLRRPVGCLGGGYAHMLGPEMIQMDELLRYSLQRDGQEQLSSFLTINYRGHPSFLAMPSALFYSDKLQSADYYRNKQLGAQGGGEANDSDDAGESKGEAYWCAKLREIEGLELPVIASGVTATFSDEAELVDMALLLPKKQYTFPIHFRGVLGSDMSVTIESGFTGESWTNPAEADAVAEIIQRLVDSGVSSQSIGVMSPFRGQVVLIRKLLRAQGLDTVNVGTIEDYQGVERDTIVLSLTRSTKSFVPNDRDARMGVFGQPKRSNVAMTRAENLLIVVGNPSVMAEDHVWRQWLWFCLRNGLWYGARGDTEALCQCDAASLKLVRYYPYTNAPSPPPLAPSSPSNGNEGADSAVTRQQQIVAISSLERLLRT